MRTKMKKLAATLCIIGTAFALSACETSGVGDVQTAPPYAGDRTAGGEYRKPASTKAAPVQRQTPVQQQTPVRQERVFRQQQSK